MYVWRPGSPMGGHPDVQGLETRVSTGKDQEFSQENSCDVMGKLLCYFWGLQVLPRGYSVDCTYRLSGNGFPVHIRGGVRPSSTAIVGATSY